MARIVESDATVNAKITYMQGTLFNTPGPVSLALFQNNLVPTPSTLLSDLVEATFDTYSRRTLSANWSAVSQVQPGEWHFFSQIQTYNAPATTPNTVYGAYVFRSTVLLFSVRFDAPVQMQVGGLPFSLQLEVIDWAASLLNAP